MSFQGLPKVDMRAQWLDRKDAELSLLVAEFSSANELTEPEMIYLLSRIATRWTAPRG